MQGYFGSPKQSTRKKIMNTKWGPHTLRMWFDSKQELSVCVFTGDVHWVNVLFGEQSLQNYAFLWKFGNLLNRLINLVLQSTQQFKYSLHHWKSSKYGWALQTKSQNIESQKTFEMSSIWILFSFLSTFLLLWYLSLFTFIGSNSL